MDTAAQNKSERINLRVKSSAKRLIVRAAGFEGKTVSYFMNIKVKKLSLISKEICLKVT